MGLRETMNKKPGVALGAGAGLIVIGIVAIALQLRAGGPPGPPSQAFFTTDDGQTYFAAGIENLPPFQRDGKEAVRAYVFQCGGGKPFVNHLERFTPEGRKAMEAAGVKDAPSMAAAAAKQTRGPMWGKEVRKPGTKQWVSAEDLAKATPILAPRCPDSVQAQPMPVEP
jgi:hypothetical protein